MSRFAHIVSAHLIQYDGGLTEVPDLSFLESQYVIRQLQGTLSMGHNQNRESRMQP